MKKVIIGNHAVSYAVMLARVEVIAAYPITPQTQIVEMLSELSAKELVGAKFIKVESEISAIAGCIGASMGGARAFTATSSQGLALMHELLHWTAGARLPLVLVNVNRALAPPWNIWTDQNDSLSQRDTGWIQLYCESNQEVLDTVIQAYKISERVLLPTMVLLDGFYLSHTSEPVNIPSIEGVDKFLPPFKSKYSLDIKDPHTFGSLAMESSYYEFRYNINKSMEKTVEVFEDVDNEFMEIFNRGYGLIEPYGDKEPETIIVTSGSITSTMREVIDSLTEKGEKIALLKIKMFRPFPKNAVIKALKSAKKVGVIDRNISFGQSGIFYEEVKASLYNLRSHPPVFGFIAGLGGRDVNPDVLNEIVSIILNSEYPEKDIYWIGLKHD